MDEMFNKLFEEIQKLNQNLENLSTKLNGLCLDRQAQAPGVETVSAAEEAKKASGKKASKPKPKAKPEEVKPEPKEEEQEVSDAEVVAEEPKEEPKEKTPEPVAYKDSDIRAALAEVMNVKSTAIAKDIINGIGNAQNVSGIPVEKYADVMAACKEALK